MLPPLAINIGFLTLTVPLRFTGGRGARLAVALSVGLGSLTLIFDVAVRNDCEAVPFVVGLLALTTETAEMGKNVWVLIALTIGFFARTIALEVAGMKVCEAVNLTVGFFA